MIDSYRASKYCCEDITLIDLADQIYNLYMNKIKGDKNESIS